MDIIDSIKPVLSNPNIAYLLLMLSILGISIEILTPGLVFPSTLGIILGVLAFFGLSTLDINPLGLTLIILSLAFFTAEALIRTRGIITALGAVFILVGSFFLFRGGIGEQANPFLITGTTLVVSAILAFISNRIAASYLKRVTTGREAIKGGVGVVRSTLNPEGLIYYEGELWKATLDEGCAMPGEEVIIRKIEGLKLFAVKKEENS
jgi:membrane-bound serine protease (ClpP class)